MSNDIREIAFHMDRVDAWLRDLWAVENLDLHQCDGTIKTGQSGLLHDIRLDVMAMRSVIRDAAP